MNLKSMQKTAVDLYNWTIGQYPNRKITVMGHSYGTGIAAYLASVKKCDKPGRYWLGMEALDCATFCFGLYYQFNIPCYQHSAYR